MEKICKVSSGKANAGMGPEVYLMGPIRAATSKIKLFIDTCSKKKV
jgi:hypothetical protein